MPSSINFKDINLLTQKSAADGTERIPVSDTQFITASQIAALSGGGGGGGGDTSDCVHKTGDESIAGDKSFTDNIEVVDASHILYSGGSGSGSAGFTRGIATRQLSSSANSITFSSLSGEPKAFILSVFSGGLPESGQSSVISVVCDSTGCHGIYTTGTQHNYSSGFTKSYSNGSVTITAPTGVTFLSTFFSLAYYYGDGTLTFKTSQVQPGSGVTAVTFTGTGLTEVPAMYVCMLETQVNLESYRRVSYYTNSAFDDDNGGLIPLGLTFFTNNPAANTTGSFSVSYNNGLAINSGGTNAGGYFHNPGTYTLYYLMASDVAGGGGGGGTYATLADELAAINDTIGDVETLLAAI